MILDSTNNYYLVDYLAIERTEDGCWYFGIEKTAWDNRQDSPLKAIFVHKVTND